MSFVAVAIGGSALIGGGASILGSSSASKAEQQSSAQATALQQQQLAESQREYDQNRADLAPYRDAGYTALGQLATGTAAGGEFNTPYTQQQFEQSPGYAFDLAQGQRGVEASAAARGGILSGGTLKALARYNVGTADQEYGNEFNRYQTDLSGRYNRLAGIAGVGQTATNSTIAASENNTATQQAGTNNIASNIEAAGNARASQYVAAGNAVGGLAKSLGSYAALGGFSGGATSNYGNYYPTSDWVS